VLCVVVVAVALVVEVVPLIESDAPVLGSPLVVGLVVGTCPEELARPELPEVVPVPLAESTGAPSLQAAASRAATRRGPGRRSIVGPR
jgi:hypothetical protein